jgi:hypothetical protein
LQVRIIFLITIDGLYVDYEIKAYDKPVTSISFGPATHNLQECKSAKNELGMPALRFAVTFFGEPKVEEWIILNNYEFEKKEVGTHEKATCVAWNSNIGQNEDIIATGGKDGNVMIWNRDSQNKVWKERAKIDLNDKIKSISWNGAGTSHFLSIKLLIFMKMAI